MKKLIMFISMFFITLFGLTGCTDGKIYTYEMETLQTTSYVKEEAHSSGVFFCIFGSYTNAKTSKIIQRYIFLAKNGPRDSYKINDVHVYSNKADEPNNGAIHHVYFIYTDEGTEPYLEYQNKGIENNYWLHLSKNKVLEIANDMFSDM